MNVVSATHAPEFLAAVPHLVGFAPRRSVVVVGFHGTRSRGALRVDLPASRERTVLQSVAVTLIGMLCRIPEVDAVVPVLYTDERFSARSGIPQRAMADALIAVAQRDGFAVRDAFCMAGNGWASYFDSDRPVTGHPLAALRAANPPMPEPASSAAQKASIRDEKPELVEQVGELLGTSVVRPGQIVDFIEQSLERTAEEPGGHEPGAEGFNRNESSAREPGAHDLARLVMLVQPPPDRDAVMLQIAFGPQVGELTLGFNRRWRIRQRNEGGHLDALVAKTMAEGRMEAQDEFLGELMSGRSSTRPDPVRIERGIRMLKRVVAVAPESLKRAPLCMLAWLNWALGRGSCAGIFVDAARRIDEDYSMAQLLDAILQAGHLPEWAFPGH